MKVIDKMHSILTASALFVLFELLSPASAHAYLDMGTGSYILQVFLAVFFAAMFTIKSYLSSIKVFFRKLFNRETDMKKDEH